MRIERFSGAFLFVLNVINTTVKDFNMAGVKGRSGRKSTTDEQKRLKVIEKAWETVYEILCDSNAPLSLRADIAKSIVVKNIPQEIEGDINLTIAERVQQARTRLIQPKPSMN